MTPTAAETRVSRAIVKLHDRDDAQLVLFAYEPGLALPPPNAQTPDRRPLSPGDTAPGPSIAEHLERQSVVPIESTIPTDMTAEQWRRQRSAPPGPHSGAPLASSLLRDASCCSGRCPATTCTTPRRATTVEKRLSFLLVCPVCGTERLVEAQPYAPHFTPHPATQSPAARPSATAAVHCRRTNGQPR